MVSLGHLFVLLVVHQRPSYNLKYLHYTAYARRITLVGYNFYEYKKIFDIYIFIFHFYKYVL